MTGVHGNAADAIPTSQRHLQGLIDGLGPSIFVGLLTLDGVVLEINQAPLTAAGLTLSDVIGRPFEDTYWWAHSADARHQLRAAIARAARGEASRYDVQNRGAGNDVIDIDFSLQPMRDAEGRVIFLIPSASVITERKQVEEALRASLGEFRSLAESMPHIVWITRPDGGNVYFNQQWMDYTGLTLEESLGDGWNTPFHPDDQRRAWDAWQLSTTTEAPYSLEVRLRRADGAYRWWLVRGVPLKDPEGTIVKWFGTCTDIHDLKLAQNEITRINRALQMLSSSNEALMRARHEPQMLEEVCRIGVEVGGYRMAWVGYAQDDADQSVKPMAHAGAEQGYLSEVDVSWDDQDVRGRGPLGRTVSTGRAVVCDDLEHASGFAPWLSLAQQRGYRGIVSLPLRDATRTFGLLALYSADVHETSAEELRLLQQMADDLAFGIGSVRSSRERERLDGQVREQAALLDIAREAIIVKGLDDRILYWSKGAERTYGWTTEEAVGQTAVTLLRNDPGQSLIAQAALLADGEWTGEMVKQRRDGREITVEARWTLMLDDQGRPRSILSINNDITERRSLEAQYLQAQKMEAIGHLAGGVAHDFNNLLTVILGFCELLLDRHADQPHRNDILEIQKAGTRAAVLTRQLLTFSRKQVVKPTRLDMNRLVADLEPMIARLLGEDVRMVLTLPPSLAPIRADRGQVEQVLINLAVNARDAMPGGGTLTIETADVELNDVYASTHAGVTSGTYVSVTVIDTGTGMTPEVQARLFEPFFTTKEVGKGTGLGLATVHGIASRSGGSVNVWSELGRGTSFVVYFPRDDTHEGADADPSPAPQAGRGTETILVVEDAEGVRELVTSLLERQGYRILLAANAEEARVLFREHPSIALILTDVVMPGTSGPALIVELIEQRPWLKVVYMSGSSEEAIVNRGMFAPGVTFLHKPFTAEALGRAVREVLDR